MKTAAVFGVIKDGKNDINVNYFKHLELSNIDGKAIYPKNPIAVAREFDCLVVCGGGDLHPKYYGEKPYSTKIVYNSTLDRYEQTIISEFIKINKPILGICRGMQSINVALGGTLVQDIPVFMKSNHQSQPEKELVHEIKISKNSKLSKFIGIRAIVNSYHHQCINKLADGLNVIAKSHDGIIEAFEGTSVPVLGIQWHPEKMCGNDVFDYFKNVYL